MKAFRAFAMSKCDKGHVHGYDRYYDEIFEDYTPNSLLEVGIKKGNSLVAWRLMFPKCDITGIDMTDEAFSMKHINYVEAKIIIEDSTKPQVLNKIEDNYDIIIDDGSHYYRDILRTFKNLHTKFNNYYIIEDWYYDLNFIKKFLNSYGYHNVSFYKSDRSRITIPEKAIFRTKKRGSRIIDQNMIIIKR
jgi:hypothetical protein